MHDVAVLHNIFLALDADFACLAALRLASECHIVVIFDNLGTDKTFLKVGVDNAGALRGFPSFMESPGTTFVGTGGQECLQVQEFVSGLDQTGNAGFFQNIWRSS